ncbi:MAG TPA: response regulator [Pirellulales bacterium]|nr:response regulator [Pirellulales bacterium]
MASPEEQGGVVHVVDDDRTIQDVTRLWLARLAATTKSYATADEFLSGYRPHAVECLLLDLQMPRISGLDLQEVLVLRQIQSPVIVISAVRDTATVVRAMRGGAIEFLEKPLEEASLLRAVSDALAHDRAVKEQSADLLRRIDQLTAREREILSLLAIAHSTAEIAGALKIRPETVERHRRHIFEKLAVDSVPALVRLMLRLQR